MEEDLEEKLEKLEKLNNYQNIVKNIAPHVTNSSILITERINNVYDRNTW